jgi:hypothetical protein
MVARSVLILVKLDVIVEGSPWRLLPCSAGYGESRGLDFLDCVRQKARVRAHSYSIDSAVFCGLHGVLVNLRWSGLGVEVKLGKSTKRFPYVAVRGGATCGRFRKRTV